MSASLIDAHGGELVSGLAGPDEAERLRAGSRGWPSWDLTPRQRGDLELLLGGALSPLRGFPGREDHESIVERMRLADGTLWPMPVPLDLPETLGEKIEPGGWLALRDPEGVMVAALNVDQVWRPDREAEARAVFSSADPARSGEAAWLATTNPVFVSGSVRGVQPPRHFDFPGLRLGPAELRQRFSRLGWRRVAAFQTAAPMHRAEHETTLRAVRELEANLLIHPFASPSSADDLDYYARVHCYRQIFKRYPRHTVLLALLPLVPRDAGAREALWHALIRRNYGCTHLVLDDALWERLGSAAGELDELAGRHQDELGVRIVPRRRLVYVEDKDAYLPQSEVPEGSRVLAIGARELRDRLDTDREIPEWFTFPEVAEALRRRHPPRHRQGFTVFLTGLSGAGKSTIANALLVRFLELGGRPVTLLDGDIVRRNLSSELGFSREHRDINIRRIGFVASEITKNGGIAICAPIAPYDAVRREVRHMIEPHGGFILAWVDTPLDVCEQRDRKGLYAKARAGIIREFTGISDPYESPKDADVVLHTTELTPEQAAQEVLLHLEKQGYVGPNEGR